MFDTNIICIISIVAEILQKYTNSLLGSVPIMKVFDVTST